MGQPVELLTEQHRVSTITVPVSELSEPVPAAPDGTQPSTDAVQVSLHIPYTGTARIFKTRPGHALTTPTPEAAVTDREVIISVVAAAGEGARSVQERLLRQEQNLEQWVSAVNRDVLALKAEVRTTARNLIAQRTSVHEQRNDIESALTIPLLQLEPGQALEIPLRRRGIAPVSSPVAAGESPEWAITDMVYEEMIRTISGFTHALERRPSSAAPLLANEETMRDWLMFMLSASYETPDGRDLFMGGETQNGAGKTDILVRYRDKNAFIGECKIWSGETRFGEAIDQLLSYTIWRDSKAALVLFITRVDATAVIEKAAEVLAARRECVDILDADNPAERRDYRFTSPADSRRVISLALLPVVVPRSLTPRPSERPTGSEATIPCWATTLSAPAMGRISTSPASIEVRVGVRLVAPRAGAVPVVTFVETASRSVSIGFRCYPAVPWLAPLRFLQHRELRDVHEVAQPRFGWFHCGAPQFRARTGDRTSRLVMWLFLREARVLV